jgi:hypothetical protein
MMIILIIILAGSRLSLELKTGLLRLKGERKYTMKIRAFSSIVISVALLSLTACAQSGEIPTPSAIQPTLPLPTFQPTPTGMPATLGTTVNLQGKKFPPAQSSPTPFPTPAAPASQSQVAQARQDLAGRLSISADQIVLTDFQEITWPDSSLGCPQPGMAYTQVTVDGISIQLQANDLVYSYHGDGIQPPFLCERVGPIGPMEPPKNK